MNEDIALRLADIETAMTELADEAERLRAVLAATLQPGDTVAVSGVPRWRMMPGKRTFRAALAEQQLDPQTLAAVSAVKVDGAALKRLSPALWELCAPQGAPFLAKVTPR